MINIETERLIIRNFRITDTAALREIILQYRASPFGIYDHPWPTSISEIHRIVEWFTTGDIFLAVCLKSNSPVGAAKSSEPIGMISISPVENALGRGYELGFVFNFNYHRQGYASESNRAVINHAFTDWRADRLWSGTAAINERSQRVLERLGFVKIGEGRLYFQCAPDGTPYEFLGLNYELTREQWQESKLSPKEPI